MLRYATRATMKMSAQNASLMLHFAMQMTHVPTLRYTGLWLHANLYSFSFDFVADLGAGFPLHISLISAGKINSCSNGIQVAEVRTMYAERTQHMRPFDRPTRRALVQSIYVLQCFACHEA